MDLTPEHEKSSDMYNPGFNENNGPESSHDNANDSVKDNRSLEKLSPTAELSDTTTFNKSLSKKKSKVDVLLRAVGDAPIMKKKKWSVESSNTIAFIISFTRKYLKLPEEETLFLYVNQLFAPPPDVTLATLFECYGCDGTLILQYSTTPAWG